MRTGLTFILLLGLATAASAQKKAVHLDCQTDSDDTTGMRLCTSLRDTVATSPRYREIGSAVKEAHFVLHVLSETIDDTNYKGVSAQSITITIAGADGLEFYLSHWVMITGEHKTTDQAQSILAALDKEADSLEKESFGK